MTTTISPITSVTEFDWTPIDTAAMAVELVDIHCQAGHFVAELSESRCWPEADPITIRLIAEANAIATPATAMPPTAVPAVVRCRDLAAAQRRMIIVLERDGSVEIEAAVMRARALLADLGELCVTLHR